MCVNVHRLFTFSAPTTKLWLSSLSSILNCSNLFQTEENLIVIHHCIKENWQMPVCYYLRCLVKYWKCHKCVIMLAFHVKKNSCIHNKIWLLSAEATLHMPLHLWWKSSMGMMGRCFCLKAVWCCIALSEVFSNSFLCYTVLVFPKMRFCCLN